MMMVLYIQENLVQLKKKEVGLEFYYGKINQNIKANGKKISQMEEENIYILMVIIILVNGKMEKLMEKENLCI